MVAAYPHYLLYSEAQSAGHGSENDRAGCEGGWKFVLETPDGRSRFEAGDAERTDDDSRLALLAVVRGLEALDQPSRVTLFTSSRYVTRGLRFGLPQWRENGWRWEHFGEMAPIKNRDLWQRVDRALQFHRLECRKWRLDRAHGTLPRPSRRTSARLAKSRGPRRRVSAPRRPFRGSSRAGQLPLLSRVWEVVDWFRAGWPVGA
jgi:ribonuclease HI